MTHFPQNAIHIHIEATADRQKGTVLRRRLLPSASGRFVSDIYPRLCICITCCLPESPCGSTRSGISVDQGNA
jgi:hypothetical protein